MWIFDSISDRLPVQLLVEADLSELRAPIQLQSGGERSAEGRGRVRPRCAPSLREAPAQDGTSIFRRLEHFHPTHLDLHRPQISVGHWTLVNVFFFYLCGTQVCLILWERWDGPDGPGPHGACGAARRCCLNMLNDIKIEDRLRTDASSLEVLLGECSPPPEPFSSSEHSWTVFSFVEEKKKMWTWLNKLFDFVCFVCSSYIWSFGLRSLNCYLNSFFFLCCSTAQKSCFIFDSVRCGSKQASVISAHSFCWVLEDVRTLGIC